MPNKTTVRFIGGPLNGWRNVWIDDVCYGHFEQHAIRVTNGGTAAPQITWKEYTPHERFYKLDTSRFNKGLDSL